MNEQPNASELKLLMAIAGPTETRSKLKMTEFNPVDKFLGDCARAEAERIARCGKSGAWCFYCGDATPVRVCGCAFGYDFGCAKQRICQRCCDAHKALADHLMRLFSLPSYSRVNARKNQAYRALFRASGELEDFDHCSRDRERHTLTFWLAQADAEFDSPEEFRSNILKAFGQVRFLDYQGLASQLFRQLEMEANRAFARLLRSL